MALAGGMGAMPPLATPPLAGGMANGTALPGAGSLIQPMPPQNGFVDATSGINSIARNLAAGFSKDPARRQVAAEQLAQEDAQRQQELQQLRAQQMHYMDQMTELAANGGWTPGIQKHTQAASASIDQLFGPGTAQQWQGMLAAADQSFQANKKQQEGFSLGEGQTRFDAQGNPVASVAAKSDVLSPEAEAQKVRLARAGQQPQQPRSPTELETLGQWLKSGDPQFVEAAKSKLGLSPGEKVITLSPGQTAFSQDGKPIVSVPSESKEPKTITLSPGQTAFGADGKPIVSLPAEQKDKKIITLSPGQSAFDENGKAVVSVPTTAAEPKTVTLSPGQTLFTQDGKPIVSVAPEKKGATSSDVSSLRGQYLQQSQAFQVVRQNHDVVVNADNTGAGDVARVFGFMKILDPTSTVREGEQATAQNAAGIPEAIRGEFNKLLGGGSLSDEARKQIVDQSEKLFKTYESRQKVTQEQFGGIAKSLDVDPNQVVLDQTDSAQGSFDTMTPEQLLDVDVSKLKSEQLDQYNAALDRAMKGK